MKSSNTNSQRQQLEAQRDARQADLAQAQGALDAAEVPTAEPLRRREKVAMASNLMPTPVFNETDTQLLRGHLRLKTAW